MNKQYILDEIKRTAEDNGGVPLGQDRFSQETGIRNADWFGIFWARWGDAVQEAGLSRNKLKEAYEEVILIGKYVDLIRELGRIPVKGELRLKRRNDPTFPNDKTFERFGSKSSLVTKALEYCHNHNGLDDVARICTMRTAPFTYSRQDVTTRLGEAMPLDEESTRCRSNYRRRLEPST